MGHNSSILIQDGLREGDHPATPGAPDSAEAVTMEGRPCNGTTRLYSFQLVHFLHLLFMGKIGSSHMECATKENLRKAQAFVDAASFSSCACRSFSNSTGSETGDGLRGFPSPRVPVPFPSLVPVVDPVVVPCSCSSWFFFH